MPERTSIGDISFDSMIHCGSGYGFYEKAENHYAFRTRLGDALYSWRFYFKITSPGDGRKIVLEATDFNHEGRTPWNEGAAVFFCDCREWHEIGTDKIKIIEWTPPENTTPYGDDSHIPYGVSYELTLEQKEIWVASPIPFTLENRDMLLRHLAETYPDFTKLEDIGETCHSAETGYPITGIRITDFSYPDADKLRCLVIAGEHPAESAVHSRDGVPVVMTFETLLLEKNNGYNNWKTSYLSVGEELLSGITDGLNAMRKSLIKKQ